MNGQPQIPWRRYVKKPQTFHKAKKLVRRQQKTCQHCGSDQDLSADHIVPRRLGGCSCVENLQILCRKCNSVKGHGPDKLGAEGHRKKDCPRRLLRRTKLWDGT